MGGKSSREDSFRRPARYSSSSSHHGAGGGGNAADQAPWEAASPVYSSREHPQPVYNSYAPRDEDYASPRLDGYPAPYSSSAASYSAPQPNPRRRLERRYSRIADDYHSLEENELLKFSDSSDGDHVKVVPFALEMFFDVVESAMVFLGIIKVTEALARAGLESSNLIVGIDFTKSNDWTGKISFNRQSLHHIGDIQNPYEQAISIIGRTLSAFDEDNLIPCFGFGDASTHDQDVFSFYADERPCNGFEEVLSRYREIVPQLRLAGPTSFAPIVEMAMTIVEQSGGQYHVLLIIADGQCNGPQVTRSVDTLAGQLSSQEQRTVDSIVRASHPSGRSPDRVPLPPPVGGYGVASVSSKTSRSTSFQQRIPAYREYNSPPHAAPPASNASWDNNVCPICLTNPKDMAFGCGHQVGFSMTLNEDEIDRAVEPDHLFVKTNRCREGNWEHYRSMLLFAISRNNEMALISSRRINPRVPLVVEVVGLFLPPLDGKDEEIDDGVAVAAPYWAPPIAPAPSSSGSDIRLHCRGRYIACQISSDSDSEAGCLDEHEMGSDYLKMGMGLGLQFGVEKANEVEGGGSAVVNLEEEEGSEWDGDGFFVGRRGMVLESGDGYGESSGLWDGKGTRMVGFGLESDFDEEEVDEREILSMAMDADGARYPPLRSPSPPSRERRACPSTRRCCP
ncbi:hypothetical protein Taro_034503 [Colocasia esculenta]|uniref:Copine C-terminal domain-containing protein n=1 Tax=Colocasia esculenta TaxID=4460 RepID=A0A843VRJ2_COLES|nr:hypothetical protein [Colocasia esculenta]